MSNALWDYCLEVYARPGVEQACLALQDDYGLDVNLLLLSCWLGEQQRPFNNDLLTQLLQMSTQWQRELIAPLRSSRRWLKHQGGALSQLRENIKAVELQAEREYIAALEIASASASTGNADAITNTLHYLEAMRCPTNPVVRENLAQLFISGCEIPADQVKTTLQ
jgi:uncharacterized protein (TIGR02444 family)